MARWIVTTAILLAIYGFGSDDNGDKISWGVSASWNQPGGARGGPGGGGLPPHKNYPQQQSQQTRSYDYYEPVRYDRNNQPIDLQPGWWIAQTMYGWITGPPVWMRGLPHPVPPHLPPHMQYWNWQILSQTAPQRQPQATHQQQDFRLGTDPSSHYLPHIATGSHYHQQQQHGGNVATAGQGSTGHAFPYQAHLSGSHNPFHPAGAAGAAAAEVGGLHQTGTSRQPSSGHHDAVAVDQQSTVPPDDYLTFVLTWPPTGHICCAHKTTNVKYTPGWLEAFPNSNFHLYTYWYRLSASRAAQEGRKPPDEPFWHYHPTGQADKYSNVGYFTGWPPRRLTIHGLWQQPDGLEGFEPQPLREEVMKHHFRNAQGQDRTHELHKKMPDLASPTFEGQNIRKDNPWLPLEIGNFWQQQWLKHGAAVVHQRLTSPARPLPPGHVRKPLESEADYFNAMLDKYNDFNIENLIKKNNLRSRILWAGNHANIAALRDAILAHLQDHKGSQPSPVEWHHFYLKSITIGTDILTSLGNSQEDLHPERSAYDAAGRPRAPRVQRGFADKTFLREIRICLDRQTLYTVGCLKGGQFIGDELQRRRKKNGLLANPATFIEIP